MSYLLLQNPLENDISLCNPNTSSYYYFNNSLLPEPSDKCSSKRPSLSEPFVNIHPPWTKKHDGHLLPSINEILGDVMSNQDTNKPPVQSQKLPSIHLVLGDILYQTKEDIEQINVVNHDQISFSPASIQELDFFNIGSFEKRPRRKSSEIDRRFKCPFENCDKSYGARSHLKSHIKLKHNTIEPYKKMSIASGYQY
ncbi:hypothetical protein K502DRAFT_340251 [Neoconidiobolus thromboides FSU 785]|nr:hypothetical protein K502DRAFT_340251 [Neoconidiobolus thromboides FSU 785]